MKNNFDKIGNFLLQDLESSYTLRDEQILVKEWFIDKMKENKKFYILEMPTGTGKSLTSQILINLYTQNLNKNANVNMLTCSKNLQLQYLKDFPYIYNLWGKGNYRCETHDTTCDIGQIIDKQKGTNCGSCPHKFALNEWLQRKVSLTNFHTHILYELFNSDIFINRNQNLLIVDEAHLLEPTVSNFISLTISKKSWEDYLSPQDTEQWLNEILNIIDIDGIFAFIKNKYLPLLKVNLKKYKSKKSGKTTTKTIKDLESSISSIENIQEQFHNKKVRFIGEKKVSNNEPVWYIQPLWVDTVMKQNLWDRYDNIILMSATIVDHKLFCKLNGIPEDNVQFITMDSPFDVKNRPIYYMPVGKMSYNTKKETLKQYKPYILKVLKKYKDKKGIIHCGNYEVWQYIKDNIKDNRLIFVDTDNRQEMINKHFRNNKDSVLVSPSLMTGIDLKDDLSRFQLILKIPYPYLGSLLNKTRYDELPMWYSWTTVLDLIQSYGRSIRSNDDYADTIILDECFSDILRYSSHLLPSYFINAIKKINK